MKLKEKDEEADMLYVKLEVKYIEVNVKYMQLGEIMNREKKK